MDKKGTGWIPDYPDVRDYHLGEINQRLKIKIQDIQITTDQQIIFDKLVDALEKLKDPKSLTPKEIDELTTSMSGSFKLIKAKVLKEKIFLEYGSLGSQVYNLQLKLLELLDYQNNLGEPENLVDELMTSLQNLKNVFYTDKTDYIERGYFGKITQAAVNKFKAIYQRSSNINDSIVDWETICKLNEILEKLGLNKLEKTDYSKTNIKTYPTLSSEQTKSEILQDNQKNPPKPSLRIGSKNQKVEYLQLFLKELKEFNGDVSGYFGPLTQEAVIDFQRKYGLVVDGIVGEKTWRVLYYLVNRKKEQQRLIVTYSSPIPVQLYEIILNIFGISDLSKFIEFDEFKAENFVNSNIFSSDMLSEAIIVPEKDEDKKELEPTIIVNEDKEELKQTINLIVKLVAQILSPLAQYINLTKAIKDVFAKLDEQFDKSGFIQKQKTINQEDIERIFQTAMENSGILPKSKQKQEFFQKLDITSVSIALSIILNFKRALNNIKDNIPQPQPDEINDRNKIIVKNIDKSIHKIDEVFKSLKDLGSVDFTSNNDESDQENPPYKIYQTVIEILKDTNGIPRELQKSQEVQGDLQLPIARSLNKIFLEKQETVYLLMPEFVDLSFWCSPIEDQGLLDSCTAFAGIALIEYFQKKSFDRHIDASPLFLYKVTRNLMHRQGNTGASLRETMKAMALFGVPPEEYWPYQEDKFDLEPSPFCYSFAQNYQALKYFRLNPTGTPNDPTGTSNHVLLLRVKTVLATGIPCAFGFTLYYSIDDNLNLKGHIPYPVEQDKVKGGHAAVAIGYDDYKVIENADGERSQGALLIRNSWGSNWGEGGYGWLPYDYVLQGLTADWWSLLKSEWFETGKFGLGANSLASNLTGPPTKNQPPPPPGSTH